MPDRIVLVDAYSTGRHLTRMFQAYGHPVAHVQSSPDIPEILRRSFTPEDFDHLLPFAPLSATAQRIRELGASHVLAGAESGVRYADELCEALGISWNLPELSVARRHKFDMIETLRAAGLPTAEQCLSADAEELVGWAANQVEWPIVVKPPHSTSSQDVFFCTTTDEIRSAHAAILGKTKLPRPAQRRRAGTNLPGRTHLRRQLGQS